MDAVSIIVFGLIGLACAAVMALLDTHAGRAAAREHLRQSLDPHPHIPQHIPHIPPIPHVFPSDFSGPGTGSNL